MDITDIETPQIGLSSSFPISFFTRLSSPSISLKMGSIAIAAPRSSQIPSLRGQAALAHGSQSIMWDIISNLWHPETNANGYVSVGVAENVMLHDVLLDFIHANVKLPSKFLTYNEGSMGSTPLKKAVSHFLNRHLNPVRPLEPRHIVMTNGCSSAVEQLSWAFMEPSTLLRDFHRGVISSPRGGGSPRRLWRHRSSGS